MPQSYQARLKDEFFLAAQVRPASAEHYIAWLEAWLDSGKRVDYVSEDNFADAKFFTISAQAAIPLLSQDLAFSIIVPPGIDTAAPAKETGCQAYFVDGPRKFNANMTCVWLEMFDTLIGDGYDLSRLMQPHVIRSCAQEAIVSCVKRMKLQTYDFYEAFDSLAFAQVDEGLKDLRAMPADKLLRDRLGLDAKTPIDAATLDIVEHERKEALKVLEVMHYKRNPAHQQPIAAFGKRAKREESPAEPDVGLSGKIQVGPPLKYREQGPQR